MICRRDDWAYEKGQKLSRSRSGGLPLLQQARHQGCIREPTSMQKACALQDQEVSTAVGGTFDEKVQV